jgi:hypothetical protein
MQYGLYGVLSLLIDCLKTQPVPSCMAASFLIILAILGSSIALPFRKDVRILMRLKPSLACSEWF